MAVSTPGFDEYEEGGRGGEKVFGGDLMGRVPGMRPPLVVGNESPFDERPGKATGEALVEWPTVICEFLGGRPMPLYGTGCGSLISFEFELTVRLWVLLYFFASAMKFLNASGVGLRGV